VRTAVSGEERGFNQVDCRRVVAGLWAIVGKDGEREEGKVHLNGQVKTSREGEER
jgi:hypothetical protein